jgi:hypothetical protein
MPMLDQLVISVSAFVASLPVGPAPDDAPLRAAGCFAARSPRLPPKHGPQLQYSGKV